MARARKARHDRACGHVKPRGDFLISASFKVAQDHDIAGRGRQGVKRIGKSQPVDLDVFIGTVVRQFLGRVDFDKGQRVAMAEVIGVDMHHDGIEPSAEIIAMPLGLVGKRPFDRILQQIVAVFGGSGHRMGHADELRQAALQFGFEQVSGRGERVSPRRFAVRPGARPASDC